jgi:hypothetical protein
LVLLLVLLLVGGWWGCGWVGGTGGDRAGGHGPEGGRVGGWAWS